MKNAHIFERELKLSTPRQIKNRNGLVGAIKPFWWLILPHTWIAIAAPLVYAWLVISQISPEIRTEARVINHYTSVSSKGNSSNNVVYRYNVNGLEREGTESVDSEIYNRIENGQNTIPIGLTRNPLDGAYVVTIPGNDTFLIVFGAVWCTVWCGAIGSIAWFSCSPALLSTKLVRSGIPAEGTITNTEIVLGSKRSRIPTIEFEYDAKYDDGGLRRSKKFKGKMKLSQKQFAEAHTGDIVTVLYDEKKPQRSVVYKFADHVAIT